MCKIVDDYANEKILEQNKGLIESLFENGCTLDMVIVSFTNLSEEIIKAIYEEVNSKKTLA